MFKTKPRQSKTMCVGVYHPVDERMSIEGTPPKPFIFCAFKSTTNKWSAVDYPQFQEPKPWM